MGQLRWLLLHLAIFCLVVAAEVQSQDPEGINVDSGQPNIIFILADDQGWSGTSVQMHPDVPESKSDFYRTPNLEKLAAAGLRFSHAYAPGPMCSPTRASLQTGKSPARLRMTNVGRGRPAQPSHEFVLPDHFSTLPTEEVTIGEQLKQVGYATAWFGKWHLGGEGPGAHGYDEHDGPTGNADGVSNDPENPKDVFGITKRGIAFMEKNVAAKKPFYLQLWHYAVHGPVQSRQASIDSFSDVAPGKIHGSANFAGMTADLDTGVGMILDKVAELGIADNTFVVYMSDHGSGQNLSSNAPLHPGKGTLWEGGLRVPLIIRGPGVVAGKFCSVPTVGWDLYPTFCHLAGVKTKLPKEVEGVNLQPLFATGSQPDATEKTRDAIAFHFPHYGQGARGLPHSCITIDGFKLVKFYGGDDELRLFELSKDIGEQTDLSEQLPQRTEELRGRLDKYLASVNAGMPSPNPDFDPTAVAQAGGRRPGGPGRANRQRQIEDRKKELASLGEAVKQNDTKKIGQIIAAMKKSLEEAPQNPRAAAGQGNGPSRREQRQQEIQVLEKAFQDNELGKISEQVAEMLKRIENLPARPGGGRRPGGRPRPQPEPSEEQPAESPSK